MPKYVPENFCEPKVGGVFYHVEIPLRNRLSLFGQKRRDAVTCSLEAEIIDYLEQNKAPDTIHKTHKIDRYDATHYILKNGLDVILVPVDSEGAIVMQVMGPLKELESMLDRLVPSDGRNAILIRERSFYHPPLF